MVLAELGGKLRSSLRKLQSSTGAIDSDTLNELLSDISRALIESDVNVKLVMTMRTNIKDRVGKLVEDAEDATGGGGGVVASGNPGGAANVNRLVQKAVVDELTSVLTPRDTKPYAMKRGRANVVLFVGLQGAGKTTSIAKFANYYQRKGWKTAMVCADTFRAGAFDQLKQNATKLRVPFYGSYTEADPVAIAEEGVGQFADEGYEVIIVDTSGRHRQESALFEEMQEISGAVRPDTTVFVMDATQGQAVYDQALAFREAVDVGSVIVTKLDGHAKGGGAISAVAATQSPIIFLGSGEHFDDFDPFNAQSFVSKLLGYGDVRGLMEEMKSVHDPKSQEELMEKMAKGQFTLRDMYNQFQNVMKMGPLNKVMGMIPGMPDYLIPQSGDGADDSTLRLKKFMYMMDSMTNDELDGRVDLNPATATAAADASAVDSRIRRIARGSGTHPKEVQMLLQCHRQFEGVVHKMGKSGMMGKGGAERQKQMAAQMRKNPSQVMQQLNKMDPNLLKSMGGSSGVMNMMQQMASSQGGAGGRGGGGGGGMPGGGMPDMNAMAQMMQSMGGAPPGGSGGMPPGMPPGMDMNQAMQMMQQMGMGGSMGGGMGGR